LRQDGAFADPHGGTPAEEAGMTGNKAKIWTNGEK